MSNQGLRQASVRAVTGTAGSYEGDWHALFDAASIASGSFNGRLLAWINLKLGTSYTEINGAMAAFATSLGIWNWSGIGTFDASTSGATPWILALGAWNDSGLWDDTASWTDA